MLKPCQAIDVKVAIRRMGVKKNDSLRRCAWTRLQGPKHQRMPLKKCQKGALIITEVVVRAKILVHAYVGLRLKQVSTSKGSVQTKEGL